MADFITYSSVAVVVVTAAHANVADKEQSAQDIACTDATPIELISVPDDDLCLDLIA